MFETSSSPEIRAAHPWWYVRIGNIRVDIEVILDLWPHLRAKLERDFAKVYGHGRQVASEDAHICDGTLATGRLWSVLLRAGA
jgi:hypothetical protein